MKRLTAVLAGSLLVSGLVQAQAPEPIGEQFQINTYTQGWQSGQSLSVDTDGSSLVVWASAVSSGTDSDSASIQARRYEANGAPLGSEFQMNSYTTGLQSAPSVAASPSGDFVVVWQSGGSWGSDSSGLTILGRFFDAEGTPKGTEFQINSYTTGDQLFPCVATDESGSFLVAWHSEGSAGSDNHALSVHARLYDSDGLPLTDEFQVNTHTLYHQSHASVASGANGDFIVVWASDTSPGTDTDWGTVQGQHYDSIGSPVGSQFQVNTYTTGLQTFPWVATDPKGDAVVVWLSFGSPGTDSDDASIQGQRYDSFGSPIGGQFQVNSYTTDYQLDPFIALDQEGKFLVTWASYGSWGTDTRFYSIQGQLFGSDGVPIGGQFQVNSYTPSSDSRSSSAFDEDGDFVVVWDSNKGSPGTDTDFGSVQGRRFTVPQWVFADSFESGDTSTWSNTVQ